jgi:hypothetical protein
MKKIQTAVEFLMDKLFDPSYMVEQQIEWFNQAKKIEKEQLEDAYLAGEAKDEQYYNKTY